MRLSLGLTPKYGRMCVPAADAGGKLSVTKGKTHGVCWAPGLKCQSQSQHPLKGKGTTPGNRRQATTPKDSVPFLELPWWCYSSECFIKSEMHRRHQGLKRSIVKAFRAVLTDTACQNRRWNDSSLVLSWWGHPGPRSWWKTLWWPVCPRILSELKMLPG